MAVEAKIREWDEAVLILALDGAMCGWWERESNRVNVPEGVEDVLLPEKFDLLLGGERKLPWLPLSTQECPAQICQRNYTSKCPDRCINQ